MINLYTKSGSLIIHSVHDVKSTIDEAPLWIDLVNITPEEEKCVEEYLGIDIPTREEIQEIEISSRLYEQDGAIYMTGIVIAKSETTNPDSVAVTFIIYKNYLITVRYSELRTFKNFSNHITKSNTKQHADANHLFSGLFDNIIDRIADILEAARKNIDLAASTIFSSSKKKGNDINYKDILHKIGSSGRLISKSRESLVTLDRVLTYAVQANIIKDDLNTTQRLKALIKDIVSLSDYANFLSTEISFLLDATLGMVNIDQNNIIKILSVGSMIFMPPTLIASTYGMNFHAIPELTWSLGYPYALGLMFLSAILPYRYFKKRGWF